MSRDARDWAWSITDLPPSTRLLLLALAEHVRDGLTCFPGQARLAAMCGVSDRQVRNLLRELQGSGLITVEHRPGRGGGRKSNLYRLEMGNRQPDSDCPEGYLEAGFRNAGSGCAQATGNPAPGNRKPGAGNRNPASAEPEERNVRRKLRDSPPYPPRGGFRSRTRRFFVFAANRTWRSVHVDTARPTPRRRLGRSRGGGGGKPAGQCGEAGPWAVPAAGHRSARRRSGPGETHQLTTRKAQWSRSATC